MLQILFLRNVKSLEILSTITLPLPANDTEQRVLELFIEPGSYQFEVWGAQGGKGAEGGSVNDKAYGGYGAYATAYVHFYQRRTIYCYFGQYGSQANPQSNQQGASAFNGGGKGGYYTNWYANTAGGGGGGTDCRFYKGDLNDERIRNSRFVVAGGGSGGGGNCPGAPGGGFYSFKRYQPETGVYEKREMKDETSRAGIGADGASNNGGKRHPYSGAGGGFYGGNAAINTDESPLAISGSGTSWGLGCDIPNPHGAAKFALDDKDKNAIKAIAQCKVLNGDMTLPSSIVVGEVEIGHKGNGAVRISQMLLGKSYCTNGEVKVIRKKNHGLQFSFIPFLGN